MLDAKSERAVATAVDELRKLYGADLVAVALYGSATGPEFIASKSDVNIAVVLEEAGVDRLKALSPYVGRWHRQGLATPLVIDRAFLDNAADVFPMELRDIQEHHRLLWGEPVLAHVTVHDHHLRYQCEHEVRGKLLHLHEAYLEVAGDRTALRALMLDSLKTFLIVMRNMSRMRGGVDTGTYESVLHTFSEHFEGEFPVIGRLLRIKLGKEAWGGDAETTFRRYAAEVGRLAKLIDSIPDRPAASDHGRVE